MEGVFFNPINLGILVEKEIVVQVEDKDNGDSLASRPRSVVSVTQSASDSRRETGAFERQETTSSPPPIEMRPRSDVTEDRGEDLVDFFRSPPPPGNVMSIPDDVSISSFDGKWRVFKAFRKKKKGKKKSKPPLIKLPDSAVSARTMEGHRYIAISIPSNYSHSEPAPPRHPASEPAEEASQQAADSTHIPTPDRGKKASKPGTGDYESLSSVSLAPKKGTHPEAVTRLAPPPRKVSLLSTVPSQEETEPGKGKEPRRLSKLERAASCIAPMSPLGSVGVSHAAEREAKSPKRGQEQQTSPQQTVSETKGLIPKRVARIVDIPATKQKQPARADNEPTTGASSIPPKSASPNANKPSDPPRVLSENPLITLTVPTRTSSKRVGTAGAGPGELDTAIDTRPTLEGRSLSSNHGDNENSAATGPRGSLAESLVTTESSPKVLKAQTATAYQSVPIVVRPPSGPESPLNLNFPSPPRNRVSRSVQADLLSPPALPGGAKSRKDRVRERKQRDMEKLKSQLRQTHRPGSHLLKPEVPGEAACPESPVLGRFNLELGSLPPSRSFLTEKMSDLGPMRPGLHLKPPNLSPEAVYKKRRGRSVSAPVMTSSSSPSSLESPQMPWEDSTAYYRRKQRQAEREENEARRVHYEAEALAQKREAQERRSREQLLRRYERLKEDRAKEMEERLHRLERNGDVLMQSLATLMQTLNTLLKERQALQRSVSAYQAATSSAPRPREQHHGFPPERSQSLRSARSYDNPPETLHHPERSEHFSRRNRPASLRLAQRGGYQRGEPGSSLRPGHGSLEEELERELELRGMHGGSGERVRQSTLEELQEQLRTQPHQSSRIPGLSGYTSSSISNEAGSLEIMQPLMRELQEAARLTEAEERAEGVTPLTESEVFNLF
ncbi:hypothetical protein F5Y05DRAFT_410589 [Hypoxylon sp. FL0543]|nr:hypothetical protein F5Y05DRAFT_410589 [Hypoxylon sp. FL0543]